MNRNKTFTKNITEELADFWTAKFSVKFIVILFICGFLWLSYSEVFRIPMLKNKMESLKVKIDEGTAEIQRLEILLTPFRTIALEKYTGSEQEALRKLAEDLEILESRTIALEERLASRILSSAQISIITEKINAIKGIKVYFSLISSDPEAKFFKEQLQKALEAGGWVVEKTEILLAGAFVGVTLYSSHDSPSEAQKILYLTLKECGFGSKLICNESLPENVIKIKIGKKNLKRINE